MAAQVSIVSEDMVTIDDLIKHVSFQPRFLHKVYV